MNQVRANSTHPTSWNGGETAITTSSQPAPTVPAWPDDLVRQRFPLLPRSKPVCRPLASRIDRVHHLAQLASQPGTDALLRACEAHNLAALIASDCAMPTLARDLCWRQFDLFAAGGPYDQATAKLALQPLINLGRLHTRDGSGSAAYRLHEALFEAAKTRAHACIDGRPVAFERIVRSGDDHREIVRWLWTILLADGLRALCRAGRWREAHQQAKQHNGIGQQLLDGRQVAIIAAASTDQHTLAMHLIDATTTPTAWEQALAACLRVLCLTWAQLPAADPVIAAMLDSYLSLDPTEHALFQVRLGLTITDLAYNHDTTPVAQRIESCALSIADAYAAHEILSNPTPLPLADSTRHTLDQTVQLASLGTPVPAPSLDNLQLSILDGEAALTRCLR